MAATIIGLAAATVLFLFVMPALYKLFIVQKRGITVNKAIQDAIVVLDERRMAAHRLNNQTSLNKGAINMYPLPRFKVAPIALALLRPGCAVGPDYEEPHTTMAETFLYSQESQSQSKANQQHNHWWTQFNDSTLNQLVEDVQNQKHPT